MADIKLPYFGNLDSTSLKQYEDIDIDFNGSSVQIDLTFEHSNIDLQRLEIAKQFIENLRIHDGNNKKYLQRDFDDTSAVAVRVYIRNHIEDLATDDLDELIGPAVKAADHERLLLKKLQLVRVGLYPGSETAFAIFDYSIGKTLTDYLLVIYTDENGNLDYITMES